MSSLLATGIAVIGIGSSGLVAQETVSEPPPERDLHLACESLTEGVPGVSFRIDAQRRRARARPYTGTRARPSYGVRFEADHIRLWPNRQAPNPPPMNFTIDRETLIVTYWKPTFPVTQERQTVATGQCVEGEPDPGLD